MKKIEKVQEALKERNTTKAIQMIHEMTDEERDALDAELVKEIRENRPEIDLERMEEMMDFLLDTGLDEGLNIICAAVEALALGEGIMPVHAWKMVLERVVSAHALEIREELEGLEIMRKGETKPC